MKGVSLLRYSGFTRHLSRGSCTKLAGEPLHYCMHACMDVIWVFHVRCGGTYFPMTNSWDAPLTLSKNWMECLVQLRIEDGGDSIDTVR